MNEKQLAAAVAFGELVKNFLIIAAKATAMFLIGTFALLYILAPLLLILFPVLLFFGFVGFLGAISLS